MIWAALSDGVRSQLAAVCEAPPASPELRGASSCAKLHLHAVRQLADSLATPAKLPSGAAADGALRVGRGPNRSPAAYPPQARSAAASGTLRLSMSVWKKHTANGLGPRLPAARLAGRLPSLALTALPGRLAAAGCRGLSWLPG